MGKGVIYIMSSAVPGLIKIGKTRTNNYEQRMHGLEHNGYRNVTALRRVFAIEVEDYDEKEILLQNIFEKSRLSDTELFAIDKNVAIQLLSSFEGTVIYPKTESKDAIFDEAVDSEGTNLIPDGIYTFNRKKKAEENRIISAKASVKNGVWTLLAGSKLSLVECAGGSEKGKRLRKLMNLDDEGNLLDDFEIGECSPSFAGVIVMFQSINGWTEWKNANGEVIDVYRKK